jgi:hypothetical protein
MSQPNQNEAQHQDQEDHKDQNQSQQDHQTQLAAQQLAAQQLAAQQLAAQQLAAQQLAAQQLAAQQLAAQQLAAQQLAAQQLAAQQLAAQQLAAQHDQEQQVITDPNFVVTYQQNINGQGDVSTATTFTTTNPAINVQISEDLKQDVEIYNDEVGNTLTLVNQIKEYAAQIHCSDFHGKGTINDYKTLFQAASNIANESSQMTLDVDVDGFNEFGQAADQLASLFTSFITKLENVNIINDSAFLQVIASSLQKIVNLSRVFGKFKETIIATSTVKLPKSIVDTQAVLQDVLGEVNCAMNYMNYFVNPEDSSLTKAVLNDNDKSVITNAVQTINNWNTLCDQGVSITMANDYNIKSIAQTNLALKTKTNALRSITASLQSKLAGYNL